MLRRRPARLTIPRMAQSLASAQAELDAARAAYTAALDASSYSIGSMQVVNQPLAELRAAVAQAERKVSQLSATGESALFARGKWAG